jgi:hypothetical protein
MRESQDDRTFYLLGWNDERHRMHLDRRLIQYELQLESPGAPDAVET